MHVCVWPPHTDSCHFTPTDYWPIKCIYTPKIIRRVSRCVSKWLSGLDVNECICWCFTSYVQLIKLYYSLLCMWLCASLSDLFFPCQILGDGADGRQPVPGHSDGAGPWEAVLFALSDVVWYQTPPCCRHHSQGKHQLTMTRRANARPVSRRGAVKPAMTPDTDV